MERTKLLIVGTLVFGLGNAQAMSSKKPETAPTTPTAAAPIAAPTQEEPAKPTLLSKKESQMKSPKNPHVIEREFLVAFDGPESAAKRGEIFAKYGVKEREKVGGGHLYLVETPEGLDAKQFREQLGHEAGVRYVEPNLKMRIMPMKTGGGPDDPQ